MSTANNTPNLEIPYGYCQCGCGQKTNISTKTDKRNGEIKGCPKRYLHGHHRRLTDPISNFWSRVDKSAGNDACWLWTGHCDDFGYGQFGWIDRKPWRTHRLSYTLTNGEIPKGLNVLHQCDNPPCCNPLHLFLGTYLDNAKDKQAKGRCSVLNGDDNPSAKLTVEQVAQIRAKFAHGGITKTQLGVEFGTHRATIGRIVNGDTWKA